MIAPSGGKKRFDATTLDRGSVPIWPHWHHAQQEADEGKEPKNADGDTRHEHMLWVLMDTGIRFENRNVEEQDLIDKTFAKHRQLDHPAVSARKEEALRLAKDKPAGPTCVPAGETEAKFKPHRGT